MSDEHAYQAAPAVVNKGVEMNDKPVTINSVEALAQIANEATERQARYERNGDQFDYGYAEGLNHAGRILDAATVLAPKPTEPDADVVERVARVIMGTLGCKTVTDSSDCINCDSTYACEHADFDYCETHDEVAAVGAPCPTAAKAARAALSTLSPSDAERKLAAVREYAATLGDGENILRATGVKDEARIALEASVWRGIQSDLLDILNGPRA